MNIPSRFVGAAQELGFTGQEALLFETLLAQGDMTGYEAARRAGISRSNAYHALASLVGKGFAYRSEAEVPAFSAIAPVDAAAVLKSRFDASIEAFLTSAPARQAPPSPFLTVSGRSAIVECMMLMIDRAQDRLYASMAREEIEIASPSFVRAADRGIKVVIIGPKGPTIPGAKHYTRRKERGRVRLIADGALVLTGELSATGGSCVYSANPQMVALIKDSLTDEIELVRTTGGRE